MIKKQNELKDIKQFGAVLGSLLIVFGIVHFFKGRAAWYPWFIGSGLTVLCTALIIPKLLKKPYNIFMKVAHAIGWLNTRIILILIYYSVLMPIAFFIKIYGKDLLNRKIEKDVLSYWTERQKARASKQDLEKQF